MNPDEQDEPLLQEFLEGNSELSRLYRRGAEETPGAQLDARIRGEARRAVAPAKRVLYSPFARHWMVPTSLAAVFVLSVSIVVLMPEPVDGPGISIDESNGFAPARQRGPRDSAGGRTEAEAEADAAPAPALRASETDSDAGAGASGSAPLPSTSTLQRGGEAAGKSMDKRKAEAVERKADAAREAPAEPEAGASAAPQAPPAALRDDAAPPAGALPEASVRNSPQGWISYIEVLLDAHDEAGAKQNLRAFRRRFPNYPLPAQLSEMAAALDKQPP